MEKRHVWPEGHWNWPIDVTHKHGVRCGEMIWVGGQVDLTPEGVVCNPGDLAAQTRSVMAHFARVLEELDCDLRDLVVLHCFYVNDGGVDEAEFLASVGECLPSGARPAVTAVPVPWLAYEGLQVEIEGYAMRRESGERTPRTHADSGSPLPPPFCQGVRSGKMIFVSAQSPLDPAGVVLHPGDIVAQTRQVMTQVRDVLAEFGADFDDVVKLNRWYAGDVGIASFEPAALACAAHFREPGPAATGIPVPRHANDEVKIKIAVVAMRGEDGRRLPRRHVWPESLWDWHVHLPYKHGLQCEEMIFTGGTGIARQAGSGGASERSLRADPPGDGPHRHHPERARGGLRRRVQDDRDLRRQLRRGGAAREPADPILLLRRPRTRHHRHSHAGARLRCDDGGDRRVRDEALRARGTSRGAGRRPAPADPQCRRSARWAARKWLTKPSLHEVTSCSRTPAMSERHRSLRSGSDMPSALCRASATPWMS